MKWTLGVVAIIFITLIVSVFTYYYQERVPDAQRAVLEIVELNERMVIVRNTGDLNATNLKSIPPAVFDPPSIAFGEESEGKFIYDLSGFTIVTVTSDNGWKIEENYGEAELSS